MRARKVAHDTLTSVKWVITLVRVTGIKLMLGDVTKYRRYFLIENEEVKSRKSVALLYSTSVSFVVLLSAHGWSAK